MSFSNSPLYRMRAALLLVPVCAALAASLVVLVFDDDSVDRQASLGEHTRSLAVVLGNELDTWRGHLFETSPEMGRDPLGSCESVNGKLLSDTRLTVIGPRGELVCGDAVPDKRLDDDSWSLFRSELQLSVPVGNQWFVYSSVVDGMLTRFFGTDFPQPLLLLSEDAETLDSHGEHTAARTLTTSVSGIPGTSWWLQTSELQPAPDTRRRLLPVAMLAFSAGVVPFAVGYRSRSRDDVRQADISGEMTAVLDDHLNIRRESSGLRARMLPSDLLRFVQPEDQHEVVQLLDSGPLLRPVRCVLVGFDCPVDIVVLNRVRVPCSPWYKRGVASGSGRFLRTARLSCRFIESASATAAVERTAVDRSASSTLDADLVVRDGCDAHAATIGLRPGDSLALLVASADRWKLESFVAALAYSPDSWHDITVRLVCGRIVDLSLCRALPSSGDVLLKIDDVTVPRLADALVVYLSRALAEAETSHGRAVLETGLLQLVTGIAPGFDVRRVVAGAGRLRLDLTHPDGVVLHGDVRRIISTAERITETLTRVPGERTSDLSLRREMALLLHDKVMQPVIWARLRTASDPDSAEVLGDLLTLLRNTIDHLRVPPWQERLHSSVYDSATALRHRGIGVSVDIDLPDPLDIQQESLIRLVIGECYTAILAHDEVEEVTTCIAVKNGAVVTSICVDTWISGTCPNPDAVFSLIRSDVEDAGGCFNVGVGENGTFTAELRLPTRGRVRSKSHTGAPPTVVSRPQHRHLQNGQLPA